MKLFIDADGCPVVDLAVRIARKLNIPCAIVCDTAHNFSKAGAQTITVSKGADSADFQIVGLIRPNDIVVTQDYGLAAMCLAKNARAVSQDGVVYHDRNITGLLEQRHTAKKIRTAGGRLKGPKKRTQQQNEAFENTLISMIKEETK